MLFVLERDPRAPEFIIHQKKKKSRERNHAWTTLVYRK